MRGLSVSEKTDIELVSFSGDFIAVYLFFDAVLEITEV
jgi:hypothetical protein